MGKRSKSSLLLGLLLILLVTFVWFRRQAEPHRVTLTWQAPNPRRGVTVVGYNVYRRTSEEGTFVKIAGKVAGSPYQDHMVNSGRTYFYVVTSVDQVGRESRFSTEAKAEIP